LNQDHILVATRYRFFTLDLELNVVQRNDPTDIDVDIEALQMLQPDLLQTGFLLSCEVDNQSIRQKGRRESEYRGEENTPGVKTWLMRATKDPTKD